MGKKPVTSSSFYRENNVIHRVERKHWNKAVDLIENYSKRRGFLNSNSLCLRTGGAAHVNPRSYSSPNTSSYLLLEIRQALLRHDWSTVCRLYSCLLDTFQNHRVLCNKLMIVFLFSSPTSNQDLFENFCKMVLGIDRKEIDIFMRSMRKLPNSIPRGFLQVIKDKLYVKTDSGRVIADAYRKVREEELSENNA